MQSIKLFKSSLSQALLRALYLGVAKRLESLDADADAFEHGQASSNRLRCLSAWLSCSSSWSLREILYPLWRRCDVVQRGGGGGWVEIQSDYYHA